MSTIVDKRAWLRAGIGTPGNFSEHARTIACRRRAGHAVAPHPLSDLLAAHGRSACPALDPGGRAQARAEDAWPRRQRPLRRRDSMLAFMHGCTSCPPDPACPESAIMTSMDDTTQARVRWFHLTPGRFVLSLLAVEVPSVALGKVRLAWVAQGLRGSDGRGCGGRGDGLDARVVRRCPGLSAAIPVQPSVAPGAGRRRRFAV